MILYGLKQATYKIVLGISLIELTSLNKEVIDWNELSKLFLDNYINFIFLVIHFFLASSSFLQISVQKDFNRTH